MNAAIAPARPEDLPALVGLWEAAVRATHSFVAEADIQYFQTLLRDGALLAVRPHCARDAAGRLLGFVGVAGERIEMLFVAPEHFGRGVGTLLLRHAVGALGAREVDVNEQNPAAAGFYARRGFRTVGRSPLDGTGRPYPLLHLRLAVAAASQA